MSNKLKFVFKWITICLISALLIFILLISVYRIYADAHDKKLNYIKANVYFRNYETFEWETEERLIKKDNEKVQVEHLLTELKKGPVSAKLMPSIPEAVGTTEIVLATPLSENSEERKVIEITFTDVFNEIPPTKSSDCIVSLVWTLTSLDFIRDVHFYIGETEFSNYNGPAGLLNRQNVRIDSQILEETILQEVVLYFADSTGETLIQEVDKIETAVSDSPEMSIVNALIAGPNDTNLTAVIPKETKVLSVKTEDVLCYVDLSEEFLLKLEPGSLKERLAVQSIVKSLTARQNIKQVQILINGDKSSRPNGIDLSQPFE
ncbi:MAG: GerMN domain-containing protein [Clostridiales bacterium]|jgi:germination protein M|nr:GerMN domain-containing protein [Clostridiales bacterium]